MNDWKYKVRIKHLLSEDGDSATAKAVGKSIHLALTSLQLRSFEDDITLEDIMYSLESVSSVSEWEELCNEGDDWDDYPPLVELNSALEELYNWANSERVWIG